jgi:hypothetical protein
MFFSVRRIRFSRRVRVGVTFPSSDRRFYILNKKHRVHGLIGSRRSREKQMPRDQSSMIRHVPGVTRVRGSDALGLVPRKDLQDR